MKRQFLLLALLLLPLLPKLEARNSSEGAFYALSSLCCHMQECIEASNTLFEEDDVQFLWNKALTGTDQTNHIQTAHRMYYEAKNAPISQNRQQLFKEAKNALKQAWLQHHPFKNDSRLESRGASGKKSKCISEKMHNEMKPYILPSKHTLKPTLDSLFSTYGINQDIDTMTRAGFTTVSVRPFSFLVVVKHPKLPGQLLKVYLESEKRVRRDVPGWKWLVQRCQGAENIRKLIKRKKLTSFVVPDKWLYPLSQHVDPIHRTCGHPVVLMVSDMGLVSQDESDRIWKEEITPKVLDELFVILSHGFASCHVAWNIPPTKNGKFACIDTEHPKRKFNYTAVKQYLSADMAKYWDTLIRKGGHH